MKFFSFLLMAVLAFSAFASEEERSDVIVLTDDTFETDTQVATGHTTGDWLVEFYAPWCGHCKNLAPIYEVLATEYKGKINISKVDCIDNPKISKRFGIKGFPTLKFFKDGMEYAYEGDRSAADLRKYLDGEYTKVKPIRATPPPTLYTVLLEKSDNFWGEYIKDMGNTYYTLVMSLSTFGMGGVSAYYYLIQKKIIQGSSRASKMKTALEIMNEEKDKKKRR